MGDCGSASAHAPRAPPAPKMAAVAQLQKPRPTKWPPGGVEGGGEPLPGPVTRRGGLQIPSIKAKITQKCFFSSFRLVFFGFGVGGPGEWRPKGAALCLPPPPPHTAPFLFLIASEINRNRDFLP